MTEVSNHNSNAENKPVPYHGSRSTSALVWGIVGLIVSFIPLLGLIFACIANARINACIRTCGPTNKTARAGKILVSIAIPVSILSLMIGIILTILIVIGVIFAGALAVLTFIVELIGAILGLLGTIALAIISAIGTLITALPAILTGGASILVALSMIFGVFPEIVDALESIFSLFKDISALFG